MLVDGLVFANGVTLTADEQAVLVVETFRYRVHRHWLDGPRGGTTEVWADNLPGIPDNLSSDGNGTVWLGFAAPRVAWVDRWLQPRPWLKEQTAKLGPLLGPSDVGLVAAFDEEGRPQRSLHDPSGGFTGTSAAVLDVDAGVLYVGSVDDSGLARLCVAPARTAWERPLPSPGPGRRGGSRAVVRESTAPPSARDPCPGRIVQSGTNSPCQAA